MGFDELLDYIGGGGIYQVALFILIGLPVFFAGYQSMAMTFMGPIQNHWCRIDRLQNLSETMQKYIAIPYNRVTDLYDQCSYYGLPYNELTDADLNSWNWTQHSFDNVSIIRCQQWSYDTTDYTNTAIIKYNLVCTRTYLKSMVFSSYMASTVIAFLLAGPLSDRWGRKRFLILTVCLQGPLGLCAAFAPNYLCFLLLRFLTTLTIVFTSSCCFVIVMELCGPNYRALPGGLYWVYFAFGFMTLPCIAYFIQDFQKLQIALALPMFLTVSYICLVPESPRWLLSKNRNSEAYKILKFISKVNKKSLPDTFVDIIANCHSGEERKETKNTTPHIHTIDIFKQPLLLSYIIKLVPSWISCSVIYYGMSFNTGSMSGNVYLNTFLSGLVEVPSFIIIVPCMQRLGRRHTTAWPLILAGLACYVSIIFIVVTLYPLIANIFLFVGKAFITLSFSAIYAYTAELFPTPVRHVGLTFCHLTGNCFGLLAPFTGPQLTEVWVALPLVLYGSLGLVSGGLIFLLPETKGRPLPDNLTDIRVNTNSRKRGYREVDVHQLETLEST